MIIENIRGNENLAVETKQAISECTLNGLISKIETVLEEDRKILDDYIQKIPSERIRCEKNKLENLKAELNLKYEHYEWLTKQDAPYWFKSLTTEKIENLESEIIKQEKKVNFLKNEKNGKKENGITDEQIELVRQYPLANVIEVNRQGFASCPFHNEKTPSLKIFADNKFKCFGCGEHGDVIDLLMKKNGLSFRDAVNFLSK